MPLEDVILASLSNTLSIVTPTPLLFSLIVSTSNIPLILILEEDKLIFPPCEVISIVDVLVVLLLVILISPRPD